MIGHYWTDGLAGINVGHMCNLLLWEELSEGKQQSKEDHKGGKFGWGLSVNVMWSVKNHHMGENWYFWVFGIMWKVELSSFLSIFPGSSVMLVSKVKDVQRLSKIKKNIRIMLLISFILQFHPVRHVTGFPYHITNKSWFGGLCTIYIGPIYIQRKNTTHIHNTHTHTSPQ